MPDSDANEAHLSALKARWEQDRGSRIYLQLAEEYRKHGRHAEALDVLQQGLAKRPRDLSGLVVLGRCRLELGEVDAAIETLQKVIARDAAHIVANRLLVEGYLLRGDAEEAGARLEICRLLSDSDPDLDGFKERLRQLKSGAVATEVPPPIPAVEDASTSPAPEVVKEPMTPSSATEVETSVSPMVEPVSAPASGKVSDDEIFALGPALAVPEFDLLWEQTLSVSRASVGDLPFAGVESAAPAAVEQAESVFEDDSVAAQSRDPNTAIHEETPTAPNDSDADKWAGAAVAGIAAAEDEDTQRLPVVGPVQDDPVQDDDAASDIELLSAEQPSVADSSAVESPDLAEEDTRPMASVPVEETSETAVEDDDTLPLQAPSTEQALSAEEVEESVPLSPSGEEAATATLGELYLRQGHLEEAEKIFRQVLQQDVENSAALAGMRRVLRQQKGELTAEELLLESSARGDFPPGLTAKKILVLKGYKEQLRGMGQKHVQ